MMAYPLSFLYLCLIMKSGARLKWPLKTYSFRRSSPLVALLPELLSSGSGSVLTIDAVRCTRSGRQWNGTRGRSTMEEITYIALAPFYTMAVAVVGYACYAIAHKAYRMDQSATETQITETTSPGSTQQK